MFRSLPGRETKRNIGANADLPSISSSDVAPGDEYFSNNTGDYYKVVLDVNGSKVWQRNNAGQGGVSGSATLVAGTATVTGVNVSASSRFFYGRRTLPGGGTAIGAELATGTVTPGASGSFVINSVAEANQAVVAADTSVVNYLIVTP